MRHDYGDPSRGLSFEHHNFFESLRRCGHDLIYFDFLSLLQLVGRDQMNRRLLEVARAEEPDLLFAVLYQDELEPSVVRLISQEGRTTTINWFCDDHWRFESFSQWWAPCFNWVVTTALDALPKYERLGLGNVIKSQWACNHFLYKNLRRHPRHDVSFVGQPHGNRREVLGALRDAGLAVDVWGHGWERGRLSQDEMIEVFNESRINLNLGNASSRPIPATPSATLRRHFSDVLGCSATGRALRRIGRAPFRAGRVFGGRGRKNKSPVAGGKLPPEQIKGRNFEVSGCGGFLITSEAENLSDYYVDRREVVCFHDVNELVSLIHYYLAHGDERIEIARAGHERTLREHTYAHRFDEIFRIAGLPRPSLQDVMAERVAPGRVLEIV